MILNVYGEQTIFLSMSDEVLDPISVVQLTGNTSSNHKD